MCGITGFISRDVFDSDRLREIASAMGETLTCRGPDKHGVWVDKKDMIGLSHQRLAILDTSEAGTQPMVSSCKRYVLVYNGEIYNASTIRRKLRNMGGCFRGESDTEVLLESISKLGLIHTLESLNGMFAFALWDKEEKKLSLVKDRLGIKPLYWGMINGFFIFGSELKALRSCPVWEPEIDRDSIASYMRHSYIPSPGTIYKNIYKLPSASVLTIKSGGEPHIKEYWSLLNVVKQGQIKRYDYSSDDMTIRALDELLHDVVEQHMISDVPLGAFLSGGIDSSVVVALMQRLSGEPINTFTIGFNEQGFDEAKHAKKISNYIGTNHTELYITPDEARSVIPLLPNIYDEPFSDSSQIPTFLISKLTQQHVKVALSGDGGDECFAGYSRYFFAKKMASVQRYTPNVVRSLLAQLIYSCPQQRLDYFSKFLPDKARPSQFGHRAYKFADVLTKENDAFYRHLVSHWQQPTDIVIGATEPRGVIWDDSLGNQIPNLIERMQYLDMLTYLPDDILTKVDRASMAVSLEARVPLLDHRIVEFSWGLPMKYRIRNGQGKWLLRQVLYKYVPKKLLERPKMGFGVPIGHWLRGPIRDWAEDLLDENKIRQAGYLNPEPIREKWNEHLQGRHNWQYLLWDILMFQAWHERWA